MAITQLSIELGERITFVQCLSGRGKKLRPDRSIMIPMEEGAYTDGVISDVPALGAYLAEQLKVEGITAKQARFVITSSRIATREVVLPAVRLSRIGEVVSVNAPDYFPVDMSAYHVSHARLGDADNGQHKVMVYAAPLSLLKDYTALAEAMGLKLLCIQYAGNAQRNLYKTVNPPETGTLFVYLNDNSSYLSFMNSGQLVLQRTLPFGGGELVEDFLSATGMEMSRYPEAFRLLTDPKQADQVYVSASSEDIRNVLTRLAMGVARTLDFFTSNFAHITIENIILTGPYAALIDLAKTVADATGHRAITMDNMPEAVAYQSNMEELLPFMNCVAALLEPLDLRPASLTQKKKKKAEKRLLERTVVPGILILLLFMGAAAGLCYWSYMGLGLAKLANNAMAAEISALEPARAAYDEYVVYKNGAISMMNLHNGRTTPNDYLIPLLAELELKLPSEIVTLSAAFTPESVSFNCTVPTMQDVSRVLVQLRTFESISIITVSPIAEVVDETGASYVTVSLTCAYMPVGAPPEPLIATYYEGEMTDDGLAALEEGGV